MTTIARRLAWAVALCAPVLLAGCADRAYLYRPAEGPNAAVGGYPAARYEIPPEAPRGDVRVVSFGIVDIEQPKSDDAIAALHVRLIVSNDSGLSPWIVDTRWIEAELRDGGDAGMPLANAESDDLPFVEIRPGRQRTINLFFPLPGGMDSASEISAFDVRWRIQTDARVVAQRTPFQRVEIDPRPRVHAGMGWYAPYWWYDRWYYPPAMTVWPTLLASPTIVTAPRVRVRMHR